jgi:hypothetical protein
VEAGFVEVGVGEVGRVKIRLHIRTLFALIVRKAYATDVIRSQLMIHSSLSFVFPL